MMWTIAMILALLWALGLATSHMLGGYLHVFLILGVGVFAYRLILGPGGPQYPKHPKHTGA